MILYTTLATIAAVALALALKASRAQVRGIERALRQKSTLVIKYETDILTLKAEVNAEKDKAKTWESRGINGAQILANTQAQLLSAEDRLKIFEEKASKLREQNRIKKQKQRERERSANK